MYHLLEHSRTHGRVIVMCIYGFCLLHRINSDCSTEYHCPTLYFYNGYAVCSVEDGNRNFTIYWTALSPSQGLRLNRPVEGSESSVCRMWYGVEARSSGFGHRLNWLSLSWGYSVTPNTNWDALRYTITASLYVPSSSLSSQTEKMPTGQMKLVGKLLG